MFLNYRPSLSPASPATTENLLNQHNLENLQDPGLNSQPEVHASKMDLHSPVVSLGSMDPGMNLHNPEPTFCGFYNPDFIIYSSIGSFYIPCIVMVVLYSKIFKVTTQILNDGKLSCFAELVVHR